MISPLASVHPGAVIGKDVIIEPFAMIHDKVTIGDGTHIMSNAVIMPFSRIGKECRIFPGAVIGAVPQDLKYKGEDTTAEIGDRTTIRECVTVNRGTIDKYKTFIGNDCLLMAYAHVAHDCTIGDHVILANGVQLAGHVDVGEYAIISGLAGAVQFTRVGAHAYVAGHTVIRKDVPPYVKAAREPMSYAGLNTVGLQRRGFSAEKIEAINAIYHYLFVSHHNMASGIDKVQKTLPDSEVKTEILQFIQSSKIGVIKRNAKAGTNDD